MHIKSSFFYILIYHWRVYDWLSFWYFLVRASIHICVPLACPPLDSLLIFSVWICLGFAFGLAFIFVCHLPPLCWICCWRCCCQTCFPLHEESTLRWPTFQKYVKVDGFDFTNIKVWARLSDSQWKVGTTYLPGQGAEVPSHCELMSPLGNSVLELKK